MTSVNSRLRRWSDQACSLVIPVGERYDGRFLFKDESNETAW